MNFERLCSEQPQSFKSGSRSSFRPVCSLSVYGARPQKRAIIAMNQMWSGVQGFGDDVPLSLGTQVGSDVEGLHVIRFNVMMVYYNWGLGSRVGDDTLG
jgi:hypothetical protein